MKPVIPQQDAVSVNQYDDDYIEIRQADYGETRDNVILVARDNLQRLIDELCDIAGIL